MKIKQFSSKTPRIEMLPLIDIVFLLLVVFIYAMLSMAVHRGLPVVLPTSDTAEIDKQLVLSVTAKTDGTIYMDKERIAFNDLAEALEVKAQGKKETGVLLFADRSLQYQQLFNVLDQIRKAGLNRVSLQSETEINQQP
jgi:biopolymer transport protein ExbD